MREVMQILKTMPREEIIGGIMFAIGFPILFAGIWVLTP